MELDVTRSELEDLIQCTMAARLNGALDDSPDTDQLLRLADLHLKLENRLELWINGGTIEQPVSERMRALGVAGIQKVYPPHDEGVTKGD